MGSSFKDINAYRCRCFRNDIGIFWYKKKFEVFFKIALAVSFYNLFGILVAHFVYEQPFELISLLTVLLPVSNGGYWFITTYVILFLLSPYVNQVLDSLEKRNYWVYLTTLAVLVFYFGGIHQLEICDGRGILAFLLSYSIGHFIHRFFPNGANIPIVRNYPVLCYLVLCTIIYILIAFTPTFISRGINFLSFGYNEIGLYVMSILFFLAFQSIKIRSKLINKLALSALAIYLLHECKFISNLATYNKYAYFTYIFNPDNDSFIQLLFHFLFCFIVMVTCILIDIVRIRLFRIIKL